MKFRIVESITFSKPYPNGTGMKRIDIEKDGVGIGYVRYSVKNNIAIVDMVQITVMGERRKGYATMLYNKMKEMESVDTILTGDDEQTEEGELFKQAYDEI